MKVCPSCGETLSAEMISAGVCDYCGDAFDSSELVSEEESEEGSEKEPLPEPEPKSDKTSEDDDEDSDDPRPNKKGRR